MIDERPSGARLAAALVAAAAAAPAPLALMLSFSEPAAVLGALLMVTLFGFPVALVHAALLGLPAYLLMRRRWRLRWWHAVPAGGVIGALPSYVLWRDGESALLLLACGAVGGLTFWLVARTPHPQDSAEELRQTFT
jgi:hypothetical protein